MDSGGSRSWSPSPENSAAAKRERSSPASPRKKTGTDRWRAPAHCPPMMASTRVTNARSGTVLTQTAAHRPLRKTRRNSDRPRAGSGNSMRPMAHSTASNCSSGKVSDLPSSMAMDTFGISLRRSRAPSSICGERSVARLRRTARQPWPQLRRQHHCQWQHPAPGGRGLRERPAVTPGRTDRKCCRSHGRILRRLRHRTGRSSKPPILQVSEPYSSAAGSICVPASAEILGNCMG